MQQQVFSLLIDDNLQIDSEDTKNENEQCSEDGSPDYGENGDSLLTAR